MSMTPAEKAKKTREENKAREAMLTEEVGLEPITMLSKDLKSAFFKGKVEVSKNEIRFLVELYYKVQEMRKATGGQIRAAEEAGDSAHLLWWFHRGQVKVERQIYTIMDVWTDKFEAARWAKSVFGIGPVLSAGLQAHVDLDRTTTYSKMIRFGGWDPTVIWRKGEKRPWNPALKKLFWLIGDGFMKRWNHPRCKYGHFIKRKWDLEKLRNERGDFADSAVYSLEDKKYGKTTEAYKHYKEGRLPPARILLRAERKGVKLFLSHWYETAYAVHYGKPAPECYQFVHMEGHTKIEKEEMAG